MSWFLQLHPSLWVTQVKLVKAQSCSILTSGRAKIPPSMAASGVSSHHRHCGCSVFVLFLHVSSILFSLASETPPLDAICGSLGDCRAGLANRNCCNALEAAIMEGGCACACKKLSSFGTHGLMASCGKNSCSRCKHCSCPYLEGAYLTSL